ncbi:MAG TPA: hypothetical protein VII06_01035 [Chloroflexota bacterium]|jgi:hypothetical protein
MARPAGFSKAEALRTVGSALEPHAVPRVELRITDGGVAVEPQAGAERRAYTWDELARVSEEQRQQRHAGSEASSWVAPLALTRWSALLRIVGQLLDTRRVGECVVDASVAVSETPRDCQVRVLVGDEVVIDGDDVQMHLLRVRTGQIAQQQPPTPLERAAPSRPWWAIWRRD